VPTPHAGCNLPTPPPRCQQRLGRPVCKQSHDCLQKPSKTCGDSRATGCDIWTMAPLTTTPSDVSETGFFKTKTAQKWSRDHDQDPRTTSLSTTATRRSSTAADRPVVPDVPRRRRRWTVGDVLDCLMFVLVLLMLLCYVVTVVFAALTTIHVSRYN